MHILVTGASGFIGKRVVLALLNKGFQITVTSRNPIKPLSRFSGLMTWKPWDLCDKIDNPMEYFGSPDAVCHLAWQDLSNYNDILNIYRYLPEQMHFIKSLLNGGLKHLLITGTCLEYGKVNGCLYENSITEPSVAYAVAKNILKQFSEAVAQNHGANIQWARLFYIYGGDEKNSTLLGQLRNAIQNPSITSFKMSSGEQLRDYLHVDEVARRLSLLIQNPQINGVINICSGKPISVRLLVEKFLLSHGAKIELDLGYYKIPEYEPIAFWGNSQYFDEDGVLNEKR